MGETLCSKCGAVMVHHRDGAHEVDGHFCWWLADFKRRGGLSGVMKDARASLNAALEQAKAEMKDTDD